MPSPLTPAAVAAPWGAGFQPDFNESVEAGKSWKIYEIANVIKVIICYYYCISYS